jgi:hypothetical protein
MRKTFIFAFLFVPLSAFANLIPDNPILADLYGYKSDYLFSTLGDSSKPVAPEKDVTWIISEPICGLALGISGIILSKIGAPFKDSSEAISNSLVGYTIGSGLGIWVMGKLVEKEKGNLILTMLGSIGGAVIFNVLYNAKRVKGYSATEDLGLLYVIPLLSGLVFYRMSL